MPQRINVPGIGFVNFPDGMSDEQIGAAIDQMQAEGNAPAKEAPLTREHAAPGSLQIRPEHPHAMIGRFAKEHLPTIGGIAGGLLAAPFTGGASIPAALAITAGGAAAGGAAGALGRAGLNAAEGLQGGITSPGDLALDMGAEALKQGASQAVGGALTKGAGVVLRKGGEGLYNLALRPEMNALRASFPGVTRAGLAQAGLDKALPVTQAGLAKAGGVVDDLAAQADNAVAAIPKGTTVPMSRITSVAGAAKPVIKEAQNRGNDAVRPVFTHVKQLGASYPAQATPQQALEIQRALARGAGSASGVIPAATRPTAATMGTSLEPEAERLIAGATQDSLEGLAPDLAGINAQIPTVAAARAAIEAALQRPALSQYMITGVGAAAGAGAGGIGTGDLKGALTGAGMAAALTNPRTLSNVAIGAGRLGSPLMESGGQGLANMLRIGGDAAVPQTPYTSVQTEQLPPSPTGQLDMSSILSQTPPPTPIDPNTGFRLIPKQDYWTPR
jgi:hypothetical protein